MEPIHFKFRLVNANGHEAGFFFDSRGTLTENELVLDKTTYPLSGIYQVVCRHQRLAIIYATDTGQATIVIAPRGGMDRKLKETIDRLCSYRWTENRHALLEHEGKAAAFRTERCRACTAVVDMTGFADTPQLYCPYCESLQRIDLATEPDRDLYRLCDQCRFYCRPTRFTVFYLILNMVSYSTHVSCHVCIRRQCWKMVGLNLLPPFIGVTFAIAQTIRAYTAGSLDTRLPELVGANAYAQKGRMEEARERYEAMLERLPVHAGLRYNLALGYARAGQWDDCLEAAQAALQDCANYQPAGNLVLEALTKLNRAAEAAQFTQAWGMPASEPTPMLPADTAHIQRRTPDRPAEGFREA